MTAQSIAASAPQKNSLLKVLGPVHVWALGVGIVLVGEFMGWNFSVGKGGAYGSLIACSTTGVGAPVCRRMAVRIIQPVELASTCCAPCSRIWT